MNKVQAVSAGAADAVLRVRQQVGGDELTLLLRRSQRLRTQVWFTKKRNAVDAGKRTKTSGEASTAAASAAASAAATAASAAATAATWLHRSLLDEALRLVFFDRCKIPLIVY